MISHCGGRMCAETPSLPLILFWLTRFVHEQCEILCQRMRESIFDIFGANQTNRKQDPEHTHKKTPKQTFDSCARASFDLQKQCSIDALKCIPCSGGTGIRMNYKKVVAFAYHKKCQNIIFVGAHVFSFFGSRNLERFYMWPGNKYSLPSRSAHAHRTHIERSILLFLWWVEIWDALRHSHVSIPTKFNSFRFLCVALSAIFCSVAEWLNNCTCVYASIYWRQTLEN